VGAAEFRRHFTAGDGKAFVADLAPGFRFYHASHTQPTSDVAFLEQMFPVARATLGDEFRFVDHMVGAEYHALPWIAHIGEMQKASTSSRRPTTGACSR